MIIEICLIFQIKKNQQININLQLTHRISQESLKYVENHGKSQKSYKYHKNHRKSQESEKYQKNHRKSQQSQNITKITQNHNNHLKYHKNHTKSHNNHLKYHKNHKNHLNISKSRKIKRIT